MMTRNMDQAAKRTWPAIRSGSVPQLYQRWLHLHEQRGALDHAIMRLPDGDLRREDLWRELEAVDQELADAIGQLAGTPAINAEDLRAKASALGALLRIAATETNTPGQETLALALALADEVSRMA